MDFGDPHSIVAELMELNHRRFRMHQDMNTLLKQLKRAELRSIVLRSETQRLKKEVSSSREKTAGQQREIASRKTRAARFAMEREQLRDDMNKLNEGGLDCSKYQSLRRAYRAEEAQLNDNNCKAEWRVGEVTQWFHDTQWKVGELEAYVRHLQVQLDHASQRTVELSKELELLREFSKTLDVLKGALVMKFRRREGRCSVELVSWNEAVPLSLCEGRPKWFEITAQNANRVELTGNFFEWKGIVPCEKCDEGTGRYGVWLSLLAGRWQFRFVVDGEMVTSAHYPTVPNEFGCLNNWTVIE